MPANINFSAGIVFKLGNFLRRCLTKNPTKVDYNDVFNSLTSRDSSCNMENAEKPEDDVMMDFESGIDTWIIDKDDSLGSFSSLDKTRTKECNGEKNMNKENLKKSPSSGKSSLRSFRIRKRVSYQELASSESESEVNKGSENGCSIFKRKRNQNPSNLKKSTTPPCKTSSKEVIKEIENLSSEEISSLLSDDDAVEYSPGSKRERLHSIENVFCTTDSKTADNPTTPLLDVKCNAKVDNCNLNSINTEYLDKQLKNKFKSVLKRHSSTESSSSSSPFERKLIRYKNNGSCSLKTDYKNISQSVKTASPKNFNRTQDKFSSLLKLANDVTTTCKICCKNTESCNCGLNRSGDYDSAQGKKLKVKSQTNLVTNLKTFSTHVNGEIAFNNDSSDTKPAKSKTSDDQSLTCNICGYISAELFIHKSHQIMIHKDKTDLECEYCNYRTTQYASLATHIRVHFRMDCPYCEYHCCLKSSLTSHLLRYHQNAYPYNCKTCGYSCETQEKFDDHLQLHALKKYQCSECKKFYSSKVGLATHVKKHLVESTVFQCYKCDLSFTKSASLKLHMKSHGKLNGRPSFLCSTCKASFVKKLDFENHVKTHMVVLKSFKCARCGSVFSQKNHLNLHMRSHVPKYFKCQYCNFECTGFKEFKNHMCIPANKLYSVEKRTLNFEVVEEDTKVNNVKNKTNIKGKLKKVSSSEKTVSAENHSSSSALDSLTADLMKRRPKLLALRQNVRCFKTRVKDERKSTMLPNKYRNPKRKLGRPRKQLDEEKTQQRNNGAFGNGTIHNKPNSAWKSVQAVKRPRRVSKRIMSKNFKLLDMFDYSFKLNRSTMALLLEPVALTNSSFIECYYQSQQPSSTVMFQHDEERHLRRQALLSCRFCNYKTNSHKLLKCHIDKYHTWDTAVVSKLFRP